MQASFSELAYAAKKITRRDRFLGEIDKGRQWSALVAEIEPFYPKGGRGRPPIGVERMLRMYIAQQCFGLSDEGIEDAIDESQSIRGFVGIDLTRESVPDATIQLTFYRLLEKHKLPERIFTAINTMLAAKGLILEDGTVVDVMINAAPSSTQNRGSERDRQMHQTKKGNPWYFVRACASRFARPPQAASCGLRAGGMKAHIGVDAKTGITQTRVTSPANVYNVTQAGPIGWRRASRPWRCGRLGCGGVARGSQRRGSMGGRAAGGQALGAAHANGRADG